MLIKCFPLLLIYVAFYNVYAQQSQIDITTDVLFQKAIGLFDNEQYSAAQTIFKQVASNDLNNNKADIDYYVGQTAIFLNQNNADQLIEDFIVKHPTHPKRNSLYFDIGNYYFNTGSYAQTRKWYENVIVTDLSSAAAETYYFNLGYSLYNSKRYADAEKNFKEVVNSEKYGSEANYYLGFIAYKADDYTQADSYFNDIEETSDLNKNLSYYKADKYFKQGDFQKAINEANKELLKSKPNEKSELNKIIGESYFNLKQYKEAITFLELYKGKKGRWSNTDHYLLGYSYYKKGNYKNAISRFNRIIGGKDAVAQNAYYHLADSYIKLEQKQEALNAFKNAYEMPFSSKIREDAGYNYSRLSYDIGNSYESVPAVLRTYLIKYPTSIHREELSSLLIDSYISSKNYKEALEVLNIESNPQNNGILQKVSYLYGLDLFKISDYKQAITHFNKAVSLNIDSEIVQLATFWKGESLYKLGEYELAVRAYNNVKDTYVDKTLQLKNYQLGYSYFKLKQYAKAITSFANFLESEPSTNYKLDAILRLGDSYFVSAQYWPAIESYNKAINLNHPNSDYAHYQKAISYGFVQKNDKKIKDLEKFLLDYKRSNYRDDAMFALANVYVAEGNTNKGIANYKRLQKELPNSNLVAKSILKEGLIYYNGDKSDQAIERFKLVAEKYPKTAEALQAVKTARLVYIDLGDTKAYADWVSTLNFVEITNGELDNTTYLAGEKQFLENNTSKAIANFENYLKQFPNGLHKLESHFYLGQLFLKAGNKNKAELNYIEVTKMNNSEFTETALYEISKIYLEKKLYSEAIPYLLRLEKEAGFPQNIIFAKTNLMKSFNEQRQYEKTLAYAKEVLADDSVKQDIKIDAQLNKARASFALGKFDEAESTYKQIAKIATDKSAAEAIYHLALFSTDRSDFSESNNYVQKLAKEFSSYREYSAKGLLLMAKNFKGLGDAYQATYILDSVISNFKDFPEVVAEGKLLLKKIKAEEAKVNSSISE